MDEKDNVFGEEEAEDVVPLDEALVDKALLEEFSKVTDSETGEETEISASPKRKPKRNKKKGPRIALLVVVIIVVLAVAGGVVYIFTDYLDSLTFLGFLDSFKPAQPLQGVMMMKDIEEESVYSLSILQYDEITVEYVKRWIDGKKDAGIVNDQPVYYTLYNDNFDIPMEMYLYMPLAQDFMGDIALSNVKVSESGKALVLNIETKDNISRTKDGTDLILHVYVEGNPDNADARTDRLYINGKQYNCPGATFTRIS
ncbi:MAG: hypothetical protein FWH33_10005 [Oscillospiraceae bacterium]|nr:hypothetical protein [Oscillospiraceae bacterium]